MNTIRKYELIEQLGEGGMGVVWKARDTELLSEVVIKCIRAVGGRGQALTYNN